VKTVEIGETQEATTAMEKPSSSPVAKRSRSKVSATIATVISLILMPPNIDDIMEEHEDLKEAANTDAISKGKKGSLMVEVTSPDKRNSFPTPMRLYAIRINKRMHIAS